MSVIVISPPGFDQPSQTNAFLLNLVQLLLVPLSLAVTNHAALLACSSDLYAVF